jgi:hypothetical protein
MRHVYANHEIPHLWAHQAQEEARNSSSSFYFSGPTIYSYGSHFPIARHVTNDGGERAILFTTASHSVTTTHHCSLVHRAIPATVPVFDVLHVQGSWGNNPNHQDNVESYIRRLGELLGKAKRSRTECNREWRQREALNLQQQLRRYVAFFDMGDVTVPASEELVRCNPGLRHTRKKNGNAGKRQLGWRRNSGASSRRNKSSAFALVIPSPVTLLASRPCCASSKAKSRLPCPELWLRALLEMGYNYGWRVSELLNLRVQQIDLATRTIRLEPGTTKNREGREVTIESGVLLELLRQCLTGKDQDDHVFTRCDKPVRDFRKSWENLCTAAGVPGLLFHDLRRTAARNLRAAGVPEEIIMRIAGWKTSSIFRRYAIVDKTDVREALQRLERARQMQA